MVLVVMAVAVTAVTLVATVLPELPTPATVVMVLRAAAVLPPVVQVDPALSSSAIPLPR